MKNSVLYIVIAALLFSVITGCNRNVKKQGNSNDALKIAVRSTANGCFHPIYAKDDCDNAIVDLVYESLISLTPQLEYEPELAESYIVSDDLLSVTFYLRKGVKWNNGVEFTAEDVKFTFEYIASIHKGSLYSNIKAISGIDEYITGKVNSIKGIQIIDKYTVKISTDEIYIPFIEKIGVNIPIFSKQHLNKVNEGDKYEIEKLLINPIGTGPYKVSDYVKYKYVELSQNESYWGNKPKIKKIIMEVINEDNAHGMIASEEQSIIFKDAVLTDEEALSYRESNAKIQILERNSYEQLVLNNNNKYLKQNSVRRALYYAIDRENLRKTLLKDEGEVVNTAYPPSYEPCLKNENINIYEYDPDKALQILTNELKWDYHNDYVYDDGEIVKFELLYTQNDEITRLCPPLIQENLRKVGIEIITRKVNMTEMIDRLGKGDYDMALVTSESIVDPDLRNSFHSSSIKDGTNYAGYKSSKLDKLIEEGEKCTDMNKRMEIYMEAAKIINEDIPVVFLFKRADKRIISANISNVMYNPFTDFYKVNEWIIE